MRTHTSGFKNEISKFGREIDGRIYHYLHYGLATEANDNILTEDNLELITEQTDEETRELINNELIYSIDIVKNGQLFQSLMKECDFEAKAEFRVGDMINPQLGIKVNDAYEYLDYGKFIIYLKEYVAENQTWRYVCFDKMLYSMIQYKPLDITYPCTIREYISAIADRIGLAFANASDSFTNYNQPVASELFENQSITYRDILDKLSEIVAGNFLINDSDELEIAYPAETNDEIDEENLKDVNVNFGEVFGPVNKISISETDSGYEYVAQDDVSIEANGTHQINITDNIFAFNGYTETIASAILNKIKGMTYSICDFSTTGICYYDFLDKFVVNVEENLYNCLLLNNEINISNGIDEHIFTDKVEKSQSDTDSYKTTIMNSKEVSFKVNQQERKIESKVSKDGVISAINQSAEEIQIQADKISLEGKTINMTSDNINIDSEYLDITSDGRIFLGDSGSDSAIPSLQIRSRYFKNELRSGSAIYKFIVDNETVSTLDFSAQWLRFYDGDDYITNNHLYLASTIMRITDVANNVETIIRSSGIETPTLTQTSKEELKKNFEKLNNALNIVKSTDIYKYNLKNENDETKKHIGLVIGDKYNYSKEITSNNNSGVDLYSMVSVCFKAIQEQQEQIETLQKQVQDLERKIK